MEKMHTYILWNVVNKKKIDTMDGQIVLFYFTRKKMNVATVKLSNLLIHYEESSLVRVAFCACLAIEPNRVSIFVCVCVVWTASKCQFYLCVQHITQFPINTAKFSTLDLGEKSNFHNKRCAYLVGRHYLWVESNVCIMCHR